MESLFSYSVRFAGLSDPGGRRGPNQDEITLCPALHFFAISDGMGGLSEGEEAARYTVRSMEKLMDLNCLKAAPDRSFHAEEAFAESLRLVSDGLHHRKNADSIRSGATFAGVWLLGRRAIFAGLGDSRCYLLPRRARLPRQMNEDQNAATALMSRGLITPEEALCHPARAHLTAFVGMRPPACPVLRTAEVAPGDRILLCSDGLYTRVPEREIARILRQSRNLSRVCEALVSRAKEPGGGDNVAVVCLQITP